MIGSFVRALDTFEVFYFHDFCWDQVPYSNSSGGGINRLPHLFGTLELKMVHGFAIILVG